MKIISFFLFFSITNSYYLQNFEGKIEFNVIHKQKDSSLAFNNSLPSKMNYYISGEFSRIDQITTIGNQSLIIDTLSKNNLLLINLMEQKICININDEKDTNQVIGIKYLDYYKNILNYKCQKAIINTYNKQTEKNSTSVVFFTKEISNSYSNNFEGLTGFPLSYEINSSDIISTYTAINIKKKNIDPQFFTTDKNTKIYSLDEFKNLMNQ